MAFGTPLSEHLPVAGLGIWSLGVLVVVLCTGVLGIVGCWLRGVAETMVRRLGSFVQPPVGHCNPATRYGSEWVKAGGGLFTQRKPICLVVPAWSYALPVRWCGAEAMTSSCE